MGLTQSNLRSPAAVAAGEGVPRTVWNSSTGSGDNSHGRESPLELPSRAQQTHMDKHSPSNAFMLLLRLPREMREERGTRRPCSRGQQSLQIQPGANLDTEPGATPVLCHAQKRYRGNLGQGRSERGREHVQLGAERWRVGPVCFQKELHVGLAARTGVWIELFSQELCVEILTPQWQNATLFGSGVS